VTDGAELYLVKSSTDSDSLLSFSIIHTL